MKKTILLFVTCFVSLITNNLYAQDWVWTQQTAGKLLDGSVAHCVDANNNIYATGSFYSDTCYLNSTTYLVRNGYNDMFIAKYDPTGSLIWVKQFGGGNLNPNSESVIGLAYNVQTNSLYMVGRYAAGCDFDNIHLNGPLGGYDGFVARMDLNGDFSWAIRLEGNDKENPGAIDTDLNGNVFFECNMPVGGLIDSTVVTDGTYLVKLNSNGEVQWATKKFNSNATSLKSDARFFRMKINGNKIFAFGQCSKGNFTLDTINFVANYGNQNILACFDISNGFAIWIKPMGSSTTTIGSIDVDEDKNSYITGGYSFTAIFEADTIYENAPTGGEAFFAKYDSTGGKIWVKNTTSTQSAYCNMLFLGSDNNLYYTGNFNGDMVIDSYTLYGTSTSYTNMFVAKSDTSGTFLGVRSVAEASGLTVVTDSDDKIYVSGQIMNTAVFGNTSLTSAGDRDGFVAKLDSLVGVGVEENIRMGHTSSDRLYIYANPTKGTCNVTIPEEFNNEKNLTLSIYDNTGKLLQQIPVQMNSGNIKLNLEEEAKGIYNVILTNGKKKYNGKVVFE